MYSLTGLRATSDGRSSAEHSKQSRIIDTESEAMLSVSNRDILLEKFRGEGDRNEAQGEGDEGEVKLTLQREERGCSTAGGRGLSVARCHL